MKKSLTCWFLCGALLAASQCVAPAADDKPATKAAPLAREDAVTVTVTASVAAIDLEKAEKKVLIKFAQM